MVERVAHRRLDDALRLDGRQPVLGLADEFRLADEHRQHAGRRDHDVLGGDDRRALVAGEIGIGAQPARQRGAEAGLMRAAFGGRDGVAVGVEEAVAADTR